MMMSFAGEGWGEGMARTTHDYPIYKERNIVERFLKRLSPSEGLQQDTIKLPECI